MTTGIVFLHYNNTWWNFKCHPRSRHLIQELNSHHAPSNSSLPISILNWPSSPTITSFVLNHCTPTPQIPSQTLSPSSFRDYLRQLPLSEQRLLGHIISLPQHTLDELTNSIISSQFKLGSDGSVRACSASFSSRIQHQHSRDIFIQASALCHTHSTFRAEGLGHLSNLYLL